MSLCTQIKDSSVEESDLFLYSLDAPLQSQQRCLLNILRSNQCCEYGKRYGFSTINSIKEFQQLVPVVDYEHISKYIDRMLVGEKNILCNDPVRFFEVTGGSTAGPKHIPYTDLSLAALQSALQPWLYDLLVNREGVFSGRSYWAISPKINKISETPGGTKIGIDNDAEYFGSEVASLISQTFVYSPSMLKDQDLDSWRYITLRYLLATEDLRFISVWSPTFILDLMDHLKKNYRSIVDDIASGNCAGSIDRFDPDPERAATVERACLGSKLNAGLLWSELDTISCWIDGASKIYSKQLYDLFPGVYIQGKGLLATEGIITIPLCETNRSVLAINSGFYEFVDDADKVHLCSEVRQGECYQVLITTYAGLYRYAIGDRVRVTGWHGKTPQLEFIGRGGLVSDLCGEKLTENFVLERLPQSKGFAMLSPMMTPERHYVLLLDSDYWSQAEAGDCAIHMDEALNDNPQYLYARKIGQLASVEAVRINAPWKHYADFASSKRRNMGDLKHAALASDSELFDYLVQYNKDVNDR